MPAKKDGTAGTPESPVDPAEAQDSRDDQAGAVESPVAAGQSRGTETMTVSSVKAAARRDAGSNGDGAAR